MLTDVYLSLQSDVDIKRKVGDLKESLITYLVRECGADCTFEDNDLPISYFSCSNVRINSVVFHTQVVVERPHLTWVEIEGKMTRAIEKWPTSPTKLSVAGQLLTISDSCSVVDPSHPDEDCTDVSDDGGTTPTTTDRISDTDAIIAIMLLSVFTLVAATVLVAACCARLRKLCDKQNK